MCNPYKNGRRAKAQKQWWVQYFVGIAMFPLPLTYCNLYSYDLLITSFYILCHLSHINQTRFYHPELEMWGTLAVISSNYFHSTRSNVFLLPQFRGQWLIKASHITLYIKLCHSSKIWAPTKLLVYVWLSVLLEDYLVPYIRGTCYVLYNHVIIYLI